MSETRTSAQIARAALREAEQEGLIPTGWSVRFGGRATVYVHEGGKFYTTNVLDTLALLARLRKRRWSGDPA